MFLPPLSVIRENRASAHVTPQFQTALDLGKHNEDVIARQVLLSHTLAIAVAADPEHYGAVQGGTAGGILILEYSEPVDSLLSEVSTLEPNGFDLKPFVAPSKWWLFR